MGQNCHKYRGTFHTHKYGHCDYMNDLTQRAKSGVKCQLSYVMCHVSCVMCQVSGVRCQMSSVRCQMTYVTCHMSLTPTPTATDPPLAYSPPIHSRLLLLIVNQIHKICAQQQIRNKIRGGSPIDRRTSTAEAPPIGKIHPFSKMPVTFKPMIGLGCPSRFRKFLTTMT